MNKIFRRARPTGPRDAASGSKGAMLYLTRKKGEAIVIGDEIEVTVIEIRGSSVKLGITSPEGVQVLRREILERIEREGRPDSEA